MNAKVRALIPMAVIERCLAAIDHMCASSPQRFAAASYRGHRTALRAFGNRQSPKRHARYNAIATAGARASRAVNRDYLSSR